MYTLSSKVGFIGIPNKYIINFDDVSTIKPDDDGGYMVVFKNNPYTIHISEDEFRAIWEVIFNESANSTKRDKSMD